MVGADGQLPLPWIGECLRQALATRHAHALLVQGTPGAGQFELALALAQAWLCEAPIDPAPQQRPCGRCGSCRLVQSQTHPDLLLVVPEALRETLGWASEVSADEPGSERAAKAKPSKEIKVDAVRRVVAFAQTTSARGRGKVIVLHPAERMNHIAANTLLKTLEEPPGHARFILCSTAPDGLLPTIRSRCQALVLEAPQAEVAMAWLRDQDVAHGDVLLRATGGHPLEALQWSRDGMDAGTWQRIPELVARGDAAAFGDWPLPRLIDTLQKLAHDAMCESVGARPRYFGRLQGEGTFVLALLLEWVRSLGFAARYADHPWQSSLMVDSLILQGREALARQAARGHNPHSV